MENTDSSEMRIANNIAINDGALYSEINEFENAVSSVVSLELSGALAGLGEAISVALALIGSGVGAIIGVLLALGVGIFAANTIIQYIGYVKDADNCWETTKDICDSKGYSY